MDAHAQARECELRDLTTASLHGDRRVYRTLLEQLTGQLRATFAVALQSCGHGPRRQKTRSKRC
jgi:hypothetical protein